MYCNFDVSDFNYFTVNLPSQWELITVNKEEKIINFTLSEINAYHLNNIDRKAFFLRTGRLIEFNSINNEIKSFSFIFRSNDTCKQVNNNVKCHLDLGAFFNLLDQVKVVLPKNMHYIPSSTTIPDHSFTKHNKQFLVWSFAPEKIYINLQNTTSSTFYFLLFISMIFGTFCGIITFNVKNPKKSFFNSGFFALNICEKKIVKYLASINEEVLQTEVIKEINQPRTTVIRAIDSLEKKNLIKIEKLGNNNMLRLSQKAIQ